MRYRPADQSSLGNEVLLPPHAQVSVREVTAALSSFGFEQAVVFSSSGSTAAPRLVCHSRRGLEVSARAVNAHLQAAESDSWLCALPTYHVGGYGIFVRAFCSKSRVYELSGAWSAERFVAACHQHEATLSALVPTQIHDLVEADSASPPSLRAVLVGGGSLDPALEERGRALGWPIVRTYGLSEAGSQVATQRGDELVVLPHIEAATSPDGRLNLRGDSMALAYLNRGADGAWENQALLDEDGWFQTDDLVELDHGVLRFLGRASSRVKVLGELVDVDALENGFLATVPQGIEAALVDVPDARSENALVLAFAPGADAASVDAWIEAFNASVAGFERISKAIAINQIPRSELGKIRRGELRKRVAEAEK